MTDFDPVVGGVLDRCVPRREAAMGNWGDVLRRAQVSPPRPRFITRRRAFVLAVAVLIVTASAAEAGVLQRAAGAFSDLLSPASPKATRVIAAAGHRFGKELRTMARQLPHKVNGPAPLLRLGQARQVATFTTPSGQVSWDAAIDRDGRGYCQVAIRHGLSLGGDCQVTDKHGYAISVATSGDAPRRAIVTGLAPTSARSVTVTRPSQPPIHAQRIGRFFWAIVAAGSPLTVTLTTGDGHVLHEDAFIDPVCVDGVDPRGQRLLAGLGFTYCAEGGVIGRFPADPALAPLCSAGRCGIPTIRNNEHLGPARATTEAATPEALLHHLRENLHTTLITDARLGGPPDGYGQNGRWLYVRVAHTRGPEATLADFYALLLAGAYGRSAPSDKLPAPGGLVYYGAHTRGVAWRAHLQIGAGSGGPTDVATLRSQIRLGLATAGLIPVSIRFARPLDSLVPIVVARTHHPGRINPPTLPDEVFGSEAGLEGTYLEIVDQSGRPITASAAESSLGVSITWTEPKGGPGPS